jgi:hypothetical protein
MTSEEAANLSRQLGIEINEWGHVVLPRWRITLANVIGWCGGKLLDLSYRVVDSGGLTVNKFVYRATPGFEGAFRSLRSAQRS